MSLTLNQLAQQLQSFNRRIVGGDGKWTADFQRFLYGLIDQSNEVATEAQEAADTAQTAAEQAQTSADTANTAATAASSAAASASLSSAYCELSTQSFLWTDTGAGFPAGDPTFDITATFYDNEGTQVADRVVRGSLTTATGLITLSDVSNSASTGYSTSSSFTGSGTANASALFVLTLPDSSQTTCTAKWTAADLSISGGISLL